MFMTKATTVQHAQLCNLGAALAIAFGYPDSINFSRLPFETQMALEDQLASVVWSGTSDLLASAVEVVEAWKAS